MSRYVISNSLIFVPDKRSPGYSKHSPGCLWSLVQRTQSLETAHSSLSALTACLYKSVFGCAHVQACSRALASHASSGSVKLANLHNTSQSRRHSMTPLGGPHCAYVSIIEGCDGLVAAPIAYQAMTQVSRALANVPRCGKYVPDSAPACPERGYFGTPNVPQLAVGAKSFPVVRVCIRGGCLQACLAAQ